MFTRSGMRYRSLVIGAGMVVYGLAAHAELVLIGGAALAIFAVARGLSRRGRGRDTGLDDGLASRR